MKSKLLLPAYNAADAETWMREALGEARAAALEGEVPVGALILDADSQIVGRGSNGRQGPGDPLAHAEVEAIRQAAASQGDWRLDGYTLVVTLEPCPMCAGLILMARIGRVIYGAKSDKWGAAGSKLDVLGGGNFPHKPEVHSGVLEAECSQVLSDYFAAHRERSS